MLSVCVITKNEERFLKKCLDSVKEIASEIIVVDAHSSDQTLKIAEAYTNKVYSRAWTDDFAAARNFAIEKATCDWLLFIDADEYLQNASHVIQLLSQTKSLQVGGFLISRKDKFFHKKDGKLDSYTIGIVRLVRNHPMIKFRNIIHEEIHSSIENAGLSIKVATTFELVHQVHQYTINQLRKKQISYLRKLNQELSINPDNYWYQYHRAKTFWFLDKRKKAERNYSNLTNEIDTPLKIRVGAINHLAILFMESGQDGKAMSTINESIKLLQGQSLAYSIKSDLLYTKGRMEEALQLLNKVNTNLCFCRYENVVPGDLYQREDLIQYKKGCIYLATGERRMAEEMFKKGIRSDPYSVDCYYGLALLFTKYNNLKEAHEKIDQCLVLNPEWLDAQVLKEYLVDV
ncbi:MAG: glycosyltransferase [Cyclobacteriaceae bacterium]